MLFENLSFDLPRGKRLGIMGPNGCGKTTLLRILLGEEEPTAGVVQRGHLVVPGYLDQHLQLLDPRQAGDPGRLAGRRPGRRPSRRCATCSAASGCRARSSSSR